MARERQPSGPVGTVPGDILAASRTAIRQRSVAQTVSGPDRAALILERLTVRDPKRFAAVISRAHGYNPIVIEGPLHSGKTRLLRAVRRSAAEDPELQKATTMIAADELNSDLLENLQPSSTRQELWRRLQQARMLLVDNAEVWRHSEVAQTLVIQQLLGPLVGNRSRLVMAVTGRLDDLTVLAPWVADGGGMGLVLSVRSLDGEDRRALVHGMAAEADVEIGDAPTDILIAKGPDTIAGLRAAVSSLTSWASQSAEPLTPDVVRALLDGLLGPVAGCPKRGGTSTVADPIPSENGLRASAGGRALAGRLIAVVGNDRTLVDAMVEWLAIDRCLRGGNPVLHVSPSASPLVGAARLAARLAALSLRVENSTVDWDEFCAAFDALRDASIRWEGAGRLKEALLAGHALSQASDAELIAVPGWSAFPLELRSILKLRQVARASPGGLMVAGGRIRDNARLIDVADSVVEVTSYKDICSLRSRHSATEPAGANVGAIWEQSLIPILDEDGAALGYRTWRVSASGELRAVHRDSSWVRGFTTSACQSCGSSLLPRCKCGLYAHSRIWMAASDWGENTSALGVVRGWGDVLVHETGWRAQHAQVLAVIVGSADQSLAQRVGVRYDCPVVQFHP